MAIAGSIVLIILGAVVAFAVDAEVSGLNISVVGYIIVIVGVIGLVFSLGSRRRGQSAHRPDDAGEPRT